MKKMNNNNKVLRIVNWLNILRIKPPISKEIEPINNDI